MKSDNMQPIYDKAGLVANEVHEEGYCDHPIHLQNSGVSRKGLTILTAAVFIVGEMAGGGILSLPNSILQAGWSGVALILVCAFLSSYTGIILGFSWQILKDRFPMYREHIRYPYPAIGYEAAGKIGRYAVTFCVNFTLFGVTTVFLLVSSDIITGLLGWPSSKCFMIPIVAVFLCPFTWLGTPKDFWPIAAGAALSTGVACILIFIQEMMVIEKPSHVVTFPDPTFETFFIAFGAILFAFGGHAIFPTVQHDMKDTRKFPWTVIISYTVVVVYYLPVSIGGYVAYGANLETNILGNLGGSGLAKAVQVMITLHLMMGVVIVINPFCQEFEELLKFPIKFGYRRILLRTFVMFVVLFVAETIPEFGVILNLVGSTTVNLLTFVFPSLFYILLRRKPTDDEFLTNKKVAIWEYLVHGFIIMVGVLGGITSTYSEIDQLVEGKKNGTLSFLPCYVDVN